MKKNIPELYGSLVFNDKVMKSKLPRDVYKALRKTIENGSHLDLDIANAVAVAMKEWAVENGATHFTHWFPSCRIFIVGELLSQYFLQITELVGSEVNFIHFS